MPQAPIDLVIVTPLAEERDAVLARLPGYCQLNPTQDDIRVYYAAEVPVRFPDGSAGRYSLVVMPLAGMGQTQAANATADAVRRWQPRYLLLVGIGGGLAQAGVALGDVLVADQVAAYELAKVTPAGPAIRWQVQPVDQRLLIAAQNFRGHGWPRTQAQRPDGDRPQVHFGPICTGDKVVAAQDLAAQWRAVWAKLIGVEMEGGGVANAAAQSAHRPGFFMVRGVSDLADGAKDSAAVRLWRPYACEIAAAWAIELLKSGPIPAAAAPALPPAPAPARPPSPAAALWAEKLEFLRREEAICADPAQRFNLKHRIAEAEAKLKELS
jgi:nucleoside phosphorylase